MVYFHWGRLGSSNFPRKHHRDTAGRYYAKVLVSNMRRRVASSRTILLGDREDPWCHIPNTQGVFRTLRNPRRWGAWSPMRAGKKRIRESFRSTKLNPFDSKFHLWGKKKKKQFPIRYQFELFIDMFFVSYWCVLKNEMFYFKWLQIWNLVILWNKEQNKILLKTNFIRKRKKNSFSSITILKYSLIGMFIYRRLQGKVLGENRVALPGFSGLNK